MKFVFFQRVPTRAPHGCSRVPKGADAHPMGAHGTPLPYIYIVYITYI